MQIVLIDALPPATVARELAGLLPQRAPTLYTWLQRARARVETLNVADVGCTPMEVWELRRAGFESTELPLSAALGSGLGPLRANDQTSDEPVWLADLVHLALGAQHAALADGRDVQITDAEDQTLFDAALPCLTDTGFTLTRLTPGRWRVGLPDGLNPPSVSPAAASRGHLENWWPQDAASRPWRRLLNDIQMVWHDHPVNVERSNGGQPVINGLWLYGGARPWTFTVTQPARVCDSLTPYAAAGDWAGWLDALEKLDRAVLAPLSPNPSSARGRGAGGEGDAPTLILTDHARLVTLTPTRRSLLHRLPRWLARQSNWTSWWHPQH